jgi:acyl-CoA dehydrogenase
VWSFETDPEFQASLDWIDEFTKEEIEPLDLVFREPGDPWDPNSPAFAAMAPLREVVKQKHLWACHLEPELGGPRLWPGQPWFDERNSRAESFRA